LNSGISYRSRRTAYANHADGPRSLATVTRTVTVTAAVTQKPNTAADGVSPEVRHSVASLVERTM